jgi:hypothetical protein
MSIPLKSIIQEKCQVGDVMARSTSQGAVLESLISTKQTAFRDGDADLATLTYATNASRWQVILRITDIKRSLN